MDNQMTGLRCRKCGAAITADQKKCPKCGAPVLLKVMMEEEKRHLPAKEIREKDKRMRREYDKMNKEKEIERQKAEKKKQAIQEKEEKKRQKAKEELEALRKKEEKREKAAEEKQEKKQEEKPVVAEPQERIDADKPEKKSKKGLVVGIIAAVLIIAAGVAIFFLTRPEPEVDKEQVTETVADAEEEEAAHEPMAEEEEPAPEETGEEPAEEAPQKPEPEPEPEPKQEQKTETKPERKITRNNYLFPSDSQNLTEADLNGLSKYDTGLIRNEIYARKGYVFKDEPYKSYFNSQAWYNPNPSAKMTLNEHEKYNVNFLLEYERSQGWR